MPEVSFFVPQRRRLQRVCRIRKAPSSETSALTALPAHADTSVFRYAPPICHSEERSDVAIPSRHTRIPLRTPICHCEERSDVAIPCRHSPYSHTHPISPHTFPQLSLRGAQRRGNPVQALPKFPHAPHIPAHISPTVIARSAATWQSCAGTPQIPTRTPYPRIHSPSCPYEERIPARGTPHP